MQSNGLWNRRTLMNRQMAMCHGGPGGAGTELYREQKALRHNSSSRICRGNACCFDEATSRLLICPHCGSERLAGTSSTFQCLTGLRTHGWLFTVVCNRRALAGLAVSRPQISWLAGCCYRHPASCFGAVQWVDSKLQMGSSVLPDLIPNLLLQPAQESLLRRRRLVGGGRRRLEGHAAGIALQGSLGPRPDGVVLVRVLGCPAGPPVSACGGDSTPAGN